LGLRGVFVDPPLDLGPEMPQQSLHRPSGAVAEGADGMTLDLGRDLPQRVDLALLGTAFRHAREHAPHPAHAFAAGRALTAALVLVEIGDARHRLHDVSRFIHDDHGGGAERRFLLAAAVEIHQQRVGLIGARRHHRHRRAAGNHREQIVPAAAHPARMLVDQLAQGDAHRFLDVAGLVDVAGDAEELGAGVVGPANAGEPGGAAAQDVGDLRNRLHVVDRGGAAIEAYVGRERRLEPRLTLFALEAFEQRRLLAANVGAGAVMEVEVEVPAVHVAFADQPRVIGLIDRRLQPFALAHEFAADIDVAGVRRHGSAGVEAALDEKMRLMPDDLAILAGAGLRLVGVDHEIMRPVADLLGHERPLQSSREAGSAAPALARGLDLIDQPVAPLVDDGFGAVPGTPPARAAKAPIIEPVKILEDAILVFEHHCLELSPTGGFGTAASRTLAASPGFLASASVRSGPACLASLRA